MTSCYTQKILDVTRKLLEFINEFGQVAGDKINRNILHSYHTNNKRSGREIKGKIPFTTASKRIKYLVIKNKEKDLYSENCKALMKNQTDITEILWWG